MGYLVVGIKSALDGHQSREGHQGSKRRLRLNVPTKAVMNAVSHGAVNIGNAADVNVGAGIENAWSAPQRAHW